jgi:hypothetical protein
MDIANHIKKLGTQHARGVLMLCKVVSINKSKKTIEAEAIDGSGVYLDARLQAAIQTNDTQLILYPKKDSTVAVLLLAGGDTEAIVVQYTEVEDVDIKVKKIALEATEIIINKGDNKGLVLVEKLVQKINALENAHNALVAKYNTHVHVTACGAGSGSAAPTVATSTDIIAPITQSFELQNTKIKH